MMLVGSFYEIDHGRLPVTDLHHIRIVMVADITQVYVSLRFPSIHALRKHFGSGFAADGNPPLDEKCMMSPDLAARLLIRRVRDTEFLEKKDSWGFWASREDPGDDEETEPRENTPEPRRITRQSKSCQTKGVSMKVERSKKHDGSTSRAVDSASKNKRKQIKSCRWSAMRYKEAEENMLKILKEKGAVWGNTILRPTLRQEARKFIGDTGLLDHLLKDMAGKVAPGGAERFMRRHNADGSLEYWLENAELMNVRKEEGIQDPYWTPQLPGWRPGIGPSPDHPVCAKEMLILRDEVSKLKREIEDLKSGKAESSLSVENIKEMLYAESARKKSGLEERLKHTKGELERLRSIMQLEEPITPASNESRGERSVIGMEMSVLSDHGMPVSNLGAEKKVERKGRATETRADRIQRLRSEFRLCKPQGTFLRPSIRNPSSSSPWHLHQPLEGSVAAEWQPTSPALVKPVARKCTLSSAMANPGMRNSLTETPNAAAKGAFVINTGFDSLSPENKPSPSSLDSAVAGPSSWLALTLAPSPSPRGGSSSDSPS